MDPASGTGQRAGRREWVGLAVLALPTLLVSIDVFVLLLALPRLSADLHPSSTELLWITDVYGFMLAGLLITMGTLGDRIGRRRLLLAGAAGFGAASVAAAYAHSPGMLIAARAVLGIAGATLAPSTLSLISTMFANPRQRAVAISTWMVCFTAGAAIGPVVGGVVLDRFWWGAVFLLGVPAMLLLLLLGPVLLPEYRKPDPGRVDLASVALSLAAILPAVYGLKELARDGWQAPAVLAVLVGVGFGLLFVRRQRRLADPLLDLGLFANRSLCTALGVMMCGTMLAGAVMVFVTQYLQQVAGLSPLRAGLWMLPASAASICSSLLSPVLARRFRPAHVIGAGMAVEAVGLLVVTRAGGGAGLAAAVAAFTLINLGGGPMVVLTIDLVMGSAPPEKAGSAAALNETSGQFGFALGIAALGSLAAAVYRSRMAGVGVPAARDTLAGATAAAGRLGGDAGAALLAAARDAFASGLHVVAGIGAVLLVAVAVLAVRMLGHVPAGGPAGGSAGEPADGSAGGPDYSPASAAARAAR